MKKNNFYSLGWIIISILIVGCTKYKEDPSISLKSAYSRIWGTWHVESFQLNGVDITDSFYNNPKTFHSSDVTFFHTDNFHRNFYTNYEGPYNKFDLDGKIINWNCHYLPGHGESLSTAFTVQFLIIKLFKKQFWVTTDFEGKKFTIKMKKVK